MEFIKRLKEEDKLEDLKAFFEAIFCGLQWQFEYKDYSSHNFIQFTIKDKKGKQLAYFNVSNFHCSTPVNLAPKSEHIHLYGEVQTVYLKFMKHIFPEYEEEYLKQLKFKYDNKVDDFMSL